MRAILGPARCRGCARLVEFRRRFSNGPAAWRNVGTNNKHWCAESYRERGLCGKWMPVVKEHCARRPGHGYEHRSRYALDNAKRRAA